MHRLNQLLGSRAGTVALAICAGTIGALLVFGTGPLNPKNVSWIFGDT
jgi:hypothetical protein